MKTIYITTTCLDFNQPHLLVNNNVSKMSEGQIPKRVKIVGRYTTCNLGEVPENLHDVVLAEADVLGVFQSGPAGMRRCWLNVVNMVKTDNSQKVDFTIPLYGAPVIIEE